jgi:succinate dehydrogenase/fumarate reductase flavoprotein subunit
MMKANTLSRRSFLKGAFVVGGTALAAPLVGSEFTQAEAAPGEQTAMPGFVETEDYTDKAIIDVDLLIIGSGFAGLWAALTAAEQGVKSIALVDKGSIGQSSVASMTLGGTSYVLDGEDMYGCMEELVKVAGYFSRQDMWEDMLASSAARYNKITSWGVSYNGPRIKSDGNIYTAITLGIDYQGKGGGKAMIGALLDQVVPKEGIRYFSKTMITRLLKEGGTVVGALGINRMTGNTIAYRAKATILASGKCSFKGQHAMGEVETGDAYALAYDAGAVINNMEFLAMDIDPIGYQMEGGTILGDFGGRLINGRNEDFMWKYDPAFGPSSDARNCTRAMAIEVKNGNGPIFLDRSTYQYALAGQFGWAAFLPQGSWQSNNEQKLVDAGFDVMTTPMPFTANSFGIIGAVKAEVDCSTTLPGLYVSSTAISFDPGKTKGIESARAFWSGEKAAISSASYIANKAAPTLRDTELQAQMDDLKTPLGNEGSHSPNDIIWELQESLFDYRVTLLKTEDAMSRALEVARLCKDKLEDVYIPDAHELVKYYEVRNMVELAEMHLLAGIERKESRVCHYREDYPKVDNENWLKWINFTKGKDGNPVMSFENIPIDSYRFQPPAKEASND